MPPLNQNSVHRPPASDIIEERGGKIFGPLPEKLAAVVGKYTAAVPQVMVAHPAEMLIAVYGENVDDLKDKPVNGAEMLAASLINIMQCWFEAYHDEREMPARNRVVAFWDCLRGLAANPLWAGPMNLAGSVVPALSHCMIDYDACRMIEMKREIKGYAWRAEQHTYICVLGALVDGAAGPGMAGLTMRDIREIVEKIN